MDGWGCADPWAQALDYLQAGKAICSLDAQASKHGAPRGFTSLSGDRGVVVNPSNLAIGPILDMITTKVTMCCVRVSENTLCRTQEGPGTSFKPFQHSKMLETLLCLPPSDGDDSTEC